MSDYDDPCTVECGYCETTVETRASGPVVYLPDGWGFFEPRLAPFPLFDDVACPVCRERLPQLDETDRVATRIHLFTAVAEAERRAGEPPL